MCRVAATEAEDSAAVVVATVAATITKAIVQFRTRNGEDQLAKSMKPDRVGMLSHESRLLIDRVHVHDRRVDVAQTLIRTRRAVGMVP